MHQIIIIRTPSSAARINGIDAIKYISDNEIKVINGYLKVPLNGYDSNIIKNKINTLITICAENIPVKGYDQLNKCIINKNHVINLIYSSAVPINSYLNPYNNNNLNEIANIILVGQYFGALKLAYNKGVKTQIKQVIHLSLLGSGVFNNKKEDISISIIKAIYVLEKIYNDVENFLEIRLQIFKNHDLAKYYQDNIN